MINTMLFVAGINTLLQTLFGTRLPVVMGPSRSFIIPVVAVALSNRFNFYIDPHQVGLMCEFCLCNLFLFSYLIFYLWKSVEV